jgi:hypothetical protein
MPSVDKPSMASSAAMTDASGGGWLELRSASACRSQSLRSLTGQTPGFVDGARAGLPRRWLPRPACLLRLSACDRPPAGRAACRSPGRRIAPACSNMRWAGDWQTQARSAPTGRLSGWLRRCGHTKRQQCLQQEPFRCQLRTVSWATSIVRNFITTAAGLRRVGGGRSAAAARQRGTSTQQGD